MITCARVRGALAFALGLSLLAALPAPTRAAPRQMLLQSPGLQASLASYIDGLDADYGVSVVDLSNGGIVAVNDEESFPTASMYKLLVMYRVFQAYDAGTLSPDDQLTITEDDMAAGEWEFSPGDQLTVGDALNKMITVSSNAAAYALVDALGGWPVVISAAGDLGMTDTVFTDDFHGTPNDFAHFFHLLAERALVSPAASDQMLDLLVQQTENDRIPALLPQGIPIAHKTGELDGVRNDGGIVRCPGESYIIVIMSKNGDPAEEVPAEAQISKMVFDHYCS